MLLFQSAMVRRGIPYVIAWIDIEGLHARQVTSDPILKDYYSALNKSRISRFSIKEKNIRVDTSDGHPGPQSHLRFATALAKEFSGRLLTVNKFSCDNNVPAIQVNGDGRFKQASPDKIARSLVSVAAHLNTTEVQVVFSESLAVEHFLADQRSVEINIERRALSIGYMRLRDAFTTYVTADLLRFNFLQNLLLAQELVLSRGAHLETSAPEMWFSELELCNPVLKEVFELLDSGSLTFLPPQAGKMQGKTLLSRLELAKLCLQRSPIDAVYRRIGGWSISPGRDDPNIYSFW